jgi:hypothetical protein
MERRGMTPLWRTQCAGPRVDSQQVRQRCWRRHERRDHNSQPAGVFGGFRSSFRFSRIISVSSNFRLTLNQQKGAKSTILLSRKYLSHHFPRTRSTVDARLHKRFSGPNRKETLLLCVCVQHFTMEWVVRAVACQLGHTRTHTHTRKHKHMHVHTRTRTHRSQRSAPRRQRARPPPPINRLRVIMSLRICKEGSAGGQHWTGSHMA